MKYFMALCSFLFSSVSVCMAQSKGVRQYYQIFTDDIIQEIKCIEYDNDTIGRKLEYKLSDDKSDIYLLNYDGISRIKIAYLTISGEIKELTRNRCTIHNLPEL